MICPECRTEGKRSKVYPGASRRTQLFCPPFYDEDGKYHNHDRNTTRTQYSCSEGHHWEETERGECWCGWSAIATAEGRA